MSTDTPLAVDCHTCHTAPGEPCKRWSAAAFCLGREKHWIIQRARRDCPVCKHVWKRDGVAEIEIKTEVWAKGANKRWRIMDAFRRHVYTDGLEDYLLCEAACAWPGQRLVALHEGKILTVVEVSKHAGLAAIQKTRWRPKRAKGTPCAGP